MRSGPYTVTGKWTTSLPFRESFNLAPSLDGSRDAASFDCKWQHNFTASTLTYAWFPPFHCRSAIAVSPLPLRKFRKNSVSAVRIMLHMWKIPLPFQLPLHHNRRSVANRIECYFCHSSIAGQPISVLVIVQATTERRFHQFRSHAQWQR